MCIRDSAKKVLRFVVLYERIESSEIMIAGLSWEVTHNALRECEAATLIKADHETVEGFAPIHAIARLRSFYYVRQENRETLKRLLYYEQQKAG